MSSDGAYDPDCNEGAWVLETLSSASIESSASLLQMAILPKKLVSSRSAAVATKRAMAAAGDLRPLRLGGTFRTFIRAEVMCIGGGKAISFRVYSRELYVCTDRNLRKLCVPPKKSISSPHAPHADKGNSGSDSD